LFFFASSALAASIEDLQPAGILTDSGVVDFKGSIRVEGGYKLMSLPIFLKVFILMG